VIRKFGDDRASRAPAERVFAGQATEEAAVSGERVDVRFGRDRPGR